MAHHFTQPPPHPNPNNRRSQPFTRHKTIPVVVKLVGNHTHDQKRMPPDTPRPAQMNKILIPSQA